MDKLRMKAKIEHLLQSLGPYDPERVYLFGSASRGEADELSDLDVVVIKQTHRPFLERLQEVGRLLSADVGGIDLLVYTPEEFAEMLREGNAFAEMIAEEGLLVYGPAKV